MIAENCWYRSSVGESGESPSQRWSSGHLSFDAGSPYVRKARSLSAALPWLYLKDISSGEMEAAQEVLVGAEAKGLSASTVARLKREWAGEYADWRTRSLERDQWLYIWVDGIYGGLEAGNFLADRHYIIRVY